MHLSLDLAAGLVPDAICAGGALVVGIFLFVRILFWMLD